MSEANKVDADMIARAVKYHDTLVELVERLCELSRWALRAEEDQYDAALTEADKVLRELCINRAEGDRKALR